MRLGLVTDVHNHAAELAAALAAFQDRGVDRVVTIGDTCDAFGRRRDSVERRDYQAGCPARHGRAGGPEGEPNDPAPRIEIPDGRIEPTAVLRRVP